MLGFGDTLEILRQAGPDLQITIVGGQAVNYWAEHYRRRLPPPFAAAFSFTSRDHDFFGTRAEARRLGAALNVEVKVPGPDDHTPTAAALDCGDGVVVQFLTHVLGVRRGQLEKHAVPVSYGRPPVRFRVMHPLHMLQSRVANVMRLKRQDVHSLRQLEVARHVLVPYIGDLIDENGPRQGLKQINSLFEYARRDMNARLLYDQFAIDPALAVRDYRGLSEAFRARRLPQMLRILADDRARRAEARLRRGRPKAGIDR